MSAMSINKEQAISYINALVNKFFKILPMKEHGDESLGAYMQSFQIELMGCRSALPGIGDNASFVTLIGLLQYLIEHPHCDVKIVRREVFHAIDLCGRLKEAINGGGDGS